MIFLLRKIILLKKRKHFLKSSEGAVLVEFSLVLPFLAFFLVFIFQLGFSQIQRFSFEKGLSETILNVSTLQSKTSNPVLYHSVLERTFSDIVASYPSSDYKISVKSYSIISGNAVLGVSVSLGSFPLQERFYLDGSSLILPKVFSYSEGQTLYIVEGYLKHTGRFDPGLPFLKESQGYRFFVKTP